MGPGNQQETNENSVPQSEILALYISMKKLQCQERKNSHII